MSLYLVGESAHAHASILFTIFNFLFHVLLNLKHMFKAFKKSMAEGKAKGLLPPMIEKISTQVIDINEKLSRDNNAPI